MQAGASGVKGASDGFTLIEVLVAVMIIVVVIGSMLQLFSNNSRFFSTMGEKAVGAYHTTLLLGSTDVGFEDKKVTLDTLVLDFNVDDALRRTLKEMKVDVEYTELMLLDGSDFSDAMEAEAAMMDEDAEVVDKAAETPIELGRTSLRLNGRTTSFIRLKQQ